MTSSSNLKSGNVQIDRLSEMINLEFEVQGTYQMLLNLGSAAGSWEGAQNYKFSRMCAQFLPSEINPIFYSRTG